MLALSRSYSNKVCDVMLLICGVLFPGGQESCGGVESGGVCYTLRMDRKSFLDADRACRLGGATLASVTSQQAQDAVANLARMRGVGQAWLGLSTDSKVWKWTAGEVIGCDKVKVKVQTSIMLSSLGKCPLTILLPAHALRI